MNASIASTLIDKLWNTNRNFCSNDYDKALEYINTILPLKIYRYNQETDFNGWAVPPKWNLIKGQIRRGDKVIYTAKQPLDVIGLSKGFSGKVTLEELKQHLHYDQRNPDVVPYHFRQNYRPWQRDWGFCVTRTFYDALESGEYTVELIVEESRGYLDVAEYTHVGQNPETFVFVAHLDHPGMANDDLAGVAAGVEFFCRLLQKKTKFSYRLLLVQEIIGSVYYLGKNPEASKNVLEACFLEMLGSKTPLALQRSYKAQGLLEQELEAIVLATKDGRAGAFRSVICNDEMIWESHNLPMSSLSRFAYPEYHSSLDTPAIISQQSLDESVDVLEKLVNKLESSTLLRKKFEGTLGLANPAYDLYVDPGQVAFGTLATDEVKALRLVADLLPILPNQIFVEQIAAQAGASVQAVLSYLQKWQDKGLVDLV